MKKIMTIIATLSLSLTVFAAPKKSILPEKYRVSYQADITSGFSGGPIRTQIVITGPDIVDQNTKRPSSMESYTIEVPFHGFDDAKSETPNTFIDPYALAAMLEESLNSNKVTLNEVTKFISQYQWLETFYANSISKKLQAPKKYRVSYAADITGGIDSGPIRTQMVITGPGIVDQNTKRPSSIESATVYVPFHGFDDAKSETPNTFIDPYALAAMLEESLNSNKVTLNEVTKFISQYQWLETFYANSISKKLQSPKKYRVSYEANITSGYITSTKYTQIVITGPGIADQNTKHPSSIESYTIEVPFHGFEDSTSNTPSTFVDPYALAAMLEESLNKDKVSLNEVAKFIAKYQWLETFYSSTLIKKINMSKSNCKAALSK